MNEGIENDAPKPINPEDVEDIDGAIEEAVSDLQENVLEHNELVEGIDFDSLDPTKISEIEMAYEDMRERLNDALAGSALPAVIGGLLGGLVVKAANFAPSSFESGETMAAVGIAISAVMAAAVGIGHVVNKIRAVKSVHNLAREQKSV
jgi:hypothetical protein